MLALIVRQGMGPVVLGAAVGMVCSFGLARLLASQLYEVEPTDPATLGAVALGLLGVSLISCYLPARRATSIDPMLVLRQE